MNEMGTCSVFVKNWDVAWSTAAVVVLTLAHRYDAVRGHRTGSTSTIYNTQQ